MFWRGRWGRRRLWIFWRGRCRGGRWRWRWRCRRRCEWRAPSRVAVGEGERTHGAVEWHVHDVERGAVIERMLANRVQCHPRPAVGAVGANRATRILRAQATVVAHSALGAIVAGVWAARFEALQVRGQRDRRQSGATEGIRADGLESAWQRNGRQRGATTAEVLLDARDVQQGGEVQRNERGAAFKDTAAHATHIVATGVDAPQTRWQRD